MSELKNTPWKVHIVNSKSFVIDSEGFNVAFYTTESTAKAIAALPETLKELEEVKARIKELEEAVKNCSIPDVRQRLLDAYEKGVADGESGSYSPENVA